MNETSAVLGEAIFVRRVAGSCEASVLARWRHGPVAIDVPASSALRLVMTLSDGRGTRHGTGSLADRARAGSVSIFPPDEGCRLVANGASDVLQLFLSKAALEGLAGVPVAVSPAFGLRDIRLRSALLRVAVASAVATPDVRLLADEALSGLALLIHRCGSEPRDGSALAPVLRRGGLAPVAKHRVDELIAAALDAGSSPTLAELARAAGLSVRHFARAFRMHTGTTPHQYVLSRRLDHAMSLLRRPGVSIAEVADAVGFKDPAYFVASFRAVMGATPGTVRDALRG